MSQSTHGMPSNLKQEKNEIFMMIVACTQLVSVLKLELLENVELSNCWNGPNEAKISSSAKIF